MKKSKIIFIAYLLFLLAAVNLCAQDDNPDPTLGVLDEAYFFFTDLLVSMQVYFIGIAKVTGRIVLIFALCMAALNHAINGTGLKDNLIKIAKATVFYIIVIVGYPNIVGMITEKTYEIGRAAAYDGSAEITLKAAQEKAAENIESETAMQRPGGNYNNIMKDKAYTSTGAQGYFTKKLTTVRMVNGLRYTSVAPAAMVDTIVATAGVCFQSAHQFTIDIGEKFFYVLVGLFCAFAVIFTGLFSTFEYLIAFMEFAFVSSVGIILFPLSLWDGTKFMSEKFISAMIGFFLKLLICTICIFIALVGFNLMTTQVTSPQFVQEGFSGKINQVFFVASVSFLIYFICKSAPGLAQSLLTGTPSLNASGAIAAAAGAVAGVKGGAAAAGGLAKKGAAVIGGGARMGANIKSAFQQAGEASKESKKEGGSGAGAFLHSLGAQAKEGIKNKGSDLKQSILGAGANGAGGGGATAGKDASANSSKNRLAASIAGEKNAEGKNYTAGEARKEAQARKNAEGRSQGADYARAQHEKAARNRQKETLKQAGHGGQTTSRESLNSGASGGSGGGASAGSGKTNDGDALPPGTNDGSGGG